MRISNHKYSIPIHNHLLHVKAFEFACVWPTPFLNRIYIDMIVKRAGKSEPVGENLRHQIPIPLLPGCIPVLYNFAVSSGFKPVCLARDRLGKSCLTSQEEPCQKNFAKEISHIEVFIGC